MKQSRFVLFLVLICLVSCQESETKPAPAQKYQDTQIVGETDSQLFHDANDIIIENPQEKFDTSTETVNVDIAIFNSDIHQTSDSDTADNIQHADLPKSSDSITYISCGDFGNCPSNFICFNGSICCPPNLPKECAGQCFPENCECKIDGEFVLCIPDNMEYCGNGVSCLKGECYFAEDIDSFICFKDNESYCGGGIACDLEIKECYEDKNIDQFYCNEKGLVPCGEEKWCENWQTCTENSCCPIEQPKECGEICCYPSEQCLDCGNKLFCFPKDWKCCNGEKCTDSEACAPDGSPACYPATADFCEDGRWCPPGTVCVPNGECCPQGSPQYCGKLCCPDYYQCLDTNSGKKCIPPNTEPCGDIWCEQDEYCADETKNLCLHWLDMLCPQGQICEDGMYCAGSTCCSFFSPNQNCGALCCPVNWQCINSGEACIPPNATYIGNGKYCNPGTFFNEENQNCDPVGWEPCGSGPACPPNMSCAKDEKAKTLQCCPADQATLCENKCCYTGFECCLGNVCMPAGAECCDGKNVNIWCPPATFCGKKGKKCIPIGADECENGDFCPISEKCTESQPACCPWAAPVPCETKCCTAGYECKTLDNGLKQCCQKGSDVCGDICCLPSQKCAELNGKKTCIPKDAEICYDTIMGDTFCSGKTFCEEDSYCMDDSYKNLEYNYCGGGETCSINESCAGLCSDFCCESEDLNLECNVFDKKSCTENANSITCCNVSYSGGWGQIQQLENTWKDKCKNIKCSSTQNGICCTYDKAMSTGCIIGCIPSGQICHDIPSANNSIVNPIESGILPQNVAFEVGEQCFDGFELIGFSPIFALGSVSVSFNPAGFAPNFQDGVYYVSDDENWIKGESGEEILVVEIVWIIDNLEGNDCPHGPYAQLYILIHKKGSQPANLNNVVWAQAKDNTVYGYNTHHLKGPLSGKDSWTVCVCKVEVLGICFSEDCFSSYGDTDPVTGKKEFDSNVEEEWVDYLRIEYTHGKAGIHKWDADEDVIYLSLRESDGEPKFDRYDDYMGLQPVKRKETKTTCGKMVELYKYENVLEDDNPDNDNDVEEDPITGVKKPHYYKTGNVAARLWLRTVIVP